MNLRLHLLGFALLLSLSLSGCKDQTEAAAVLPKMCKYFPGSTIYKFDKRVLWIQTNVGGISSAMATEIFTDSCQKAAWSLGKIKFNAAEELRIDGRSILVIGFKHGIVACDLRNGSDANGVPVGQVMNWQMAKAWLTQQIGYMPTPDQILVITLADAQNTPKGEPMQLQTLAQIQAQSKAMQQEQINDYVLKEKVEQDQKGY